VCSKNRIKTGRDDLYLFERASNRMNSVFVLGSNKEPLMPTRPARARKLLSSGKAAVYRMQPFTIILHERETGDTQPIEVKVDPGSKTTGVALVSHFEQQGAVVLWGGNINHRGQAMKNNLESRASFRRSRRGRNTRYRAPRFLNRCRTKGWLPPSVESRVGNTESVIYRLATRCPITQASVEIVKFDMQAMVNPEISGTEYQQGELAGYEVREYLLEKWNRTCAYCGAKGVPLQVEHIQPKALGGSNRVSNLTLACQPCNHKKGAKPVAEFLKNKPDLLKKIKAQSKVPLKDAAAVNASRWVLANRLQKRWPTDFGTGGRTKFNRTKQGYAKDHWIDAACVGVSGDKVTIREGMKPLTLTRTGRGKHQVVRTDAYGFPCAKAGRIKRVKGVGTGDIINITLSDGKYAGIYRTVRVYSIRATGRISFKTGKGIAYAKAELATVVQRNDGFSYIN
jgi:5-methylcytosine-specific restriction endonuclease McrA